MKENAEAFQSLTGKGVCAVVKANAYGHGAEECTLALSGVVSAFAVATIDEAKAIKVAACGKDVLIFTPPITACEVLEAARNGFIVSISSLYTAELVAAVSKRTGLTVRAHLKVNTGMNRYGMDERSLGKACKLLQELASVRVEGIFSHLYASALSSAEAQRKRFLRSVVIAKRYFPSLISHLSATYGALLGERFAFDLVRVGLGLYGYLPEGEGIEIRPKLEKVMQVFARVTGNRIYRYGGVGYGEEKGKAMAGEELSLLRYGYADGFLRKKDGGAFGGEAQVGNLCMDACIRKGRLPLGKWISVLTDADETAKKSGTIPYEVLCAATRRAEFLYVYE